MSGEGHVATGCGQNAILADKLTRWVQTGVGEEHILYGYKSESELKTNI